MPSFDKNSEQCSSVAWRSWQPDNLLIDVGTPTTPLPALDSLHNEQEIQAELARLHKQSEQQGFQQGLSRGEEEGRKQGFEVGMREGREAGLAQGKADALAQQQQMMCQTESWVSNFKQALDSLESLVPGRLVQLSLMAIQQLYGSATLADPTGLLKQIRLLMKQDALLQGNVQLFVNPDDREAITRAMGDMLKQRGWELHNDAQLAPGGCRIVSPEREYDGSLETRWQALCQLAREELSQ
jgi:flagellar assembly protein FliH